YRKGTNMSEGVERHHRHTGGFINKGVEFSLEAHVLPSLRLNGMYSYLHTSLAGLTGAPRHQYFIGAEWMPVKRLSVSVNLKGVGRLYVAPDISYQSYAVVNARVEYGIIRCLSIFCNLDNMTAARYVINRGYTMPGFTAMCGFRIKINA
ncbi:MAG: TonB-dependent receptor, partial [Duncaniella sp.]|nr:TonB-dependent receptor [Duncaniella sp.]